MRVRTQKAFSAYIGSQIIPLAKGDEIEGDLALALVAASCAVEIVDDPQGVLAEAAEFHAGPVPAAALVRDGQQIGEPAPVEAPPVPAPGPDVTKVRARSAFGAYDGASVVQFAAGQEVEGELAALLAASDCDVEVLETAAVEAEDEKPADPPVVEQPTAPSTQGPAAPAGDSADDPAAAYDPGPQTAKVVMAHVAEHPDEAEAILAAEKAGRARTTLLGDLADFVAAKA